mmetsp:Transcript_8123/g.26788  ORF Transcript_8123/g.26788 Transcript_8123/m.26788 type:complete len:237 (+) Transcript_8123:1204-1914(+)
MRRPAWQQVGRCIPAVPRLTRSRPDRTPPPPAVWPGRRARAAPPSTSGRAGWTYRWSAARLDRRLIKPPPQPRRWTRPVPARRVGRMGGGARGECCRWSTGRRRGPRRRPATRPMASTSRPRQLLRQSARRAPGPRGQNLPITQGRPRRLWRTSLAQTGAPTSCRPRCPTPSGHRHPPPPWRRCLHPGWSCGAPCRPCRWQRQSRCRRSPQAKGVPRPAAPPRRPAPPPAASPAPC